MTKQEMLDEMEEHNWEHDLSSKSSYSEVKEEYKEMIDMYESAVDAMYPNGRDYDAD